MLASIKLRSPRFTPPADGRIALAGVPLIGQVYAEGRATTARIVDAAGQVQVYDLTVGPPGSGAHLEITNDNLMFGIEVRVQSGEIIHA